MKRIEVIFTGTAMEFPVIGSAKTLVTPATREHERRAGEYQAGVASNPRASWREMVRHRVATVTRTRYAAVY